MNLVVEMRCPLDSQRMFGKLMTDPNTRIVEGNLIEFACDKCRRKTGRRTLHRFNLAGECVETAEV